MDAIVYYSSHFPEGKHSGHLAKVFYSFQDKPGTLKKDISELGPDIPKETFMVL